MNDMFDTINTMKEIIKVIGVGGGGSNAVNFMYNQGIKGVDFVVCNTDLQALDISPVPFKIQLGKTLTEGRGAGMLPEVGMNAAFENIEDLREMLSLNTKMVFVTAGMGGGTGTGAAPVIAQLAKELGILTVGIVTLPFDFEGKKRKLQAEEGLERLRQNVDTLLVINNEKLRSIGKSLTLSEAFQKADNILTVAAKGIAEVIAETGLINVDFNDVNTVLRNSGRALMGSAVASGEGRAIEAVKNAMNSPLLNDHDIHGARFVLLNIKYGSHEILMDEIMEITDFIQDAAGEHAEVIWGHGLDSTLGESLSVTLVATGFASVDNTSGSLPERTVVSLNEEVRKEIVSPLSNPFDTVASDEVTASEEPFLKTEVEETPSFTQNTVEPQEPTSATKVSLFDELDVAEESRISTEPEFIWDVQSTESPVFDLSNETTSESSWGEDTSSSVAENITTKVEEPISEPEIIRHVLEDDFMTGDAGQRTQPQISSEELQRRNEQRIATIQEITSKIQNSENLSEYETQPAYLRRNVEIRDEKRSEEQRISRFGLSEGSDGQLGLGNNSFLHDNID